MIAWAAEVPTLWFVMRATGIVLEVLFTLVVVLGLLSTRTRAGRGIPRFLVQAFHRNVSLIAVALLAAHVVAAVTHRYVNVTWWQVIVPWGGYEPLWLGLGALAFDLTVVIVAVSLLRARLKYRAWLAVHLTSYLAWVAALAHGWGIGTDAAAPWSQAVTLGGIGLVLAALTWRLLGLRTRTAVTS